MQGRGAGRDYGARATLPVLSLVISQARVVLSRPGNLRDLLRLEADTTRAPPAPSSRGICQGPNFSRPQVPRPGVAGLFGRLCYTPP